MATVGDLGVSRVGAYLWILIGIKKSRLGRTSANPRAQNHHFSRIDSSLADRDFN